MSGTKEELVKSWLIKGNRDLMSARELADSEISLLDTATYHCHQAAEKAIKGYLLFHDVRFEKTHDIELLVSQAIVIDPSFVNCIDAARILSPLVVEYCYPGDYVEPEPEEFQEAYDASRTFYSFVVARLPESTHP